MQTMDMTDQQALDLMMHDTFQTQAEADGKFMRAKTELDSIANYSSRNRQWWTLTQEYEAAKGARLRWRIPRSRVDQGPLPLEYLEKILCRRRQTNFPGSN